MKKVMALLLMLTGFTVFSATTASANDLITNNLSAGTSSYYVFPEHDYLGIWGVEWRVVTKATSNYAGSGSGAITLGTYYTDQISTWGVPYDIVYKGATYLVDSYNNKTYSYNTACDVLSNATTLTMNKTVGWSSSKNPYITYPLKPKTCGGQDYVVANHVFINR